ncbi:hypothetical protein BJ123_11023 [Rhodopseudomonas thermotolerans]|uniref:Uncharacterized protein n=2 Tax=Rhodopseudomonas TaxID=1073 RepID=A0A336JS12_9BRAD|nr:MULTISPECIES: hypothetical protein [Rhodopseudomonas]RED34387.1 hypothetical protein BJ125_11023 [Rhodopseudomonas pentothenatexigens]REG02583.1 hypothetical protein BJ123_11023 [Rhodopseudomonas thermotolerans]SSW91056.1 hypothetical protein SAMN05892882_11023 [Rhodopseudomonas pentothenatexigens]
MPLQNRVTPFGEIVAVAARGLFTGNRGIIHDPATRTLLKRRWSSPAWITCTCDFRGRRRDVMATRSWTELFFLDEATALAAGHRPCYYCRRTDANAFAAAWAKGNGLERVTAAAIDAALHRERLDGRAKRLHPLPCPIEDLPDGAMVQAITDDTTAASHLMRQGRALAWSFAGYRAVDAPLRNARLLTPPSTVRALQAGYRPVFHASILGPADAEPPIHSGRA